MIFHQAIFIFLISSYYYFVPSSSSSSSSIEVTEDTCSQSCSNISVPYPFGFSRNCTIPLSCGQNGEITIGEFKVQNISSDHILVELPDQCNRSIQALAPLDTPYFALTSRNGLLLQDCTAISNACVFSPNMAASRLGLQNCSLTSNISCYLQEDYNGFEFLDLNMVMEKSNCRFLYSSIAIDNSSLDSASQSLSLEFHRVELGWWLDGGCPASDCYRNALCVNVSRKDGQKGHRCKCKEGYAGDGFAKGGGCRKVLSCNSSNYMSDQCSGTPKVAILVGGIIAGASLMASLALICYCIKRRSYLKNNMSAKRLLYEAAGSSSVPFYPYKEIERATSGFAEKQRLGTGAYGTVYAGKLHNDEWVAIKKIRHRDPDGIEQVMNEIKLLSSVSHPNLVRLLGCCIENGEQILVYEFMPNGTLSQHLQRERGSVLPWTIRLTIATETAHAIAYLHSAVNPPIYHRDIKSSNILIDYNFNSKVADFGLSRFGMTDDSHISTAPQGTPGYVDPQYHQNFHLSDKSDVYSFGVVLVEIITAKKVVDFSRPHSEINLAALAIERIGKGRVDEIIDPFLEPHRDAWTLTSVHKVAELAFRCLAFHRDMRPSMMEVAEELEQIRLSGWAPMEENICIASSAASSCSSPYNASEKSVSNNSKKTAVGSRRLIVPHKAGDCLPTMEEVKDSSPVSVQDPWLSEQSSPSTNSLLGNAAR